MTKEDVVAEHERHPVAPDEILADEKCVREAVRLRLYREGEADAPAAAVAEQALELRLILRRRDDKNVPYTREHQRRQRVIDHQMA